MRPNPSFRIFFIGLAVSAAASLSSCATHSTHTSLEPAEKARLLLELANGHLMDGDAIGALQNLELAERADPSIADIYQSRAIAFSYRKDLPRAVEAAEEAFRRDPARPDFQNTLGKLLMDSGNFVRAEPLLRRAADNPLYREAYKARTALGLMQLHRGDKVRAEQEFSLAISSNGQLACGAYFERGKIRLEGSRPASAIQDLENSSHRFCGGKPEADLILGDAYVRSNQVDRARKKYLSIQQLYPETAEAKQALEKLRMLP